MMRRSVFDEVGGLDAQNLAVAFNDVDMCLRIRERGYWVVYTPYAVLFHHESATRNMHSNPGEEEYMRRRWGGVIRHDPFYNPNLTREAEDYSLNFDAPTIAERLGPIEDGPLTVRHGPEAGFSPTLGPKGEVPQDQAGDRPPAVSSKTLIDLVTRTIDLGRHIQGMVGRWRDRFSELSTRLERQTSRPAPERDPPVANRDRPGGDAPGAQYREGAGGDESVERRAAGNGEHVATGPPPTVAPPAVAAPEGVNGHRPKRNSYPQVRRRIREVVNAELPTGSVVVVVSRGDDNLLQLGPRRGWHFPQTEAGVYAGFYPADSGEAIAHLEEIRRKGADYLLFPSTAFWWLGFYGDFQKHLESHYPCVCSDPSCLIFQLSTTPGGHWAGVSEALVHYRPRQHFARGRRLRGGMPFDCRTQDTVPLERSKTRVTERIVYKIHIDQPGPGEAVAAGTGLHRLDDFARSVRVGGHYRERSPGAEPIDPQTGRRGRPARPKCQGLHVLVRTRS